MRACGSSLLFANCFLRQINMGKYRCQDEISNDQFSVPNSFSLIKKFSEKKGLQ